MYKTFHVNSSLYVLIKLLTLLHANVMKILHKFNLVELFLIYNGIS